MRLALLVLLAGTLAACAATRPEAGLPPYYAAAPLGVRDPMPRAYDIPSSGDAALDRLMLRVAGSLDRHDWRGLTFTLDEAEYAAQFAFLREGGRSPEAAVSQVLEETFGLGTVGNEVFPVGLDREARPFAGLARIRAVTLEGAEAAGEGAWQVEGRVRLDDRTARRLSFTVMRTGGAYRVVVPMG